jgi:exopolysaccharide biosynthesis polyprenyl glycosylphosphotransferase
MALRVLDEPVRNQDDVADARRSQPLTPPRAVVSRLAMRIVALTGAVDLVAIIAAYAIAKDLRIGWFGEQTLTRIDPIILATIPGWLIIFFAYGLYSRHLVLEPQDSTLRLLNAIAMNMVMLVLTAFALHVTVSRGWIAILWISVSVLVIIGRLAVRRLTGALKSRRVIGLRALVVGANSEARTLARLLGNKRSLGYEVLGFVGDFPREVDGLPVVSDIAGLRESVSKLDVAIVFVAASAIGPEALAGIDRALVGLAVRVRTSLGLPHLAASRVVVEPVDGMAMMSFQRDQPSASDVALKRAFDVVLAMLGLLVGLPLMLVIAVAIRLNSKGPALFSQQRVGEGGQAFTLYKFRTMVQSAESLRSTLENANEADGTLFKMRHDPRVTSIGRHLRRLGLDELPQLINILKGDMSLVGPRPALPAEAANWSEEVAGRLRAKPGLTGLWQVSGRHELAFEDYVRYDLFYVENWSFALDLRIVARTPAALLSRRGAY